MTFQYLDPEIYRKYRDTVIELSNSIQVDINEHLPADRRRRGLSDREIAERLQLDEATVTEIRAIAERDYYDLAEWDRAIEFKRKACREYVENRIGLKRKPAKS
jgi:ribosome-binding protein aMBF1 (putative translation factor)